MSRSVGWRPVLEGADAQRAHEAIAAIVADLIEREITDPSPLVRGWAGVALVHGYLARDGDPVAGRHAHEALAHALERLGLDQPGPWLGTGFVGVAWVMEHLQGVVDADEETLDEIDAMVTDLLARETWPWEYGLWEGVVGLGVYALERRMHEGVRRAVIHLDRLAERTPSGATWWNQDLMKFTGPRGYHNLGMALGVAGVGSFLAEACAASVAPELALPLLAEAVTWLLSHERVDTVPRFPMCVGLAVPEELVRNGWCYGDAAIAAMLVRAGSVAHEPAWVSRGRDLARAMARGPIDDVADRDVAFCHGTAGRAHLFNRLAQAIGDAELFDTARRYYLETLDRIRWGELKTPSLTTGSSGVALALLAAVSRIEPCWDRAFLVALPPGG